MADVFDGKYEFVVTETIMHEDDYVMLNTTVENGIVYYEEPVATNFIAFASNHIDCDAIATREGSSDLGNTMLVAYASDVRYNRKLKDIFYEKFGKEQYIIMRGLSEVQGYI